MENCRYNLTNFRINVRKYEENSKRKHCFLMLGWLYRNRGTCSDEIFSTGQAITWNYFLFYTALSVRQNPVVRTSVHRQSVRWHIILYIHGAHTRETEKKQKPSLSSRHNISAYLNIVPFSLSQAFFDVAPFSVPALLYFYPTIRVSLE